MKSVIEKWEEYYNYIYRLSVDGKDSQSVPFKMSENYDLLNESERNETNELLGNWLISKDSGRRYTARFIISEKKLKKLRTQVVDSISKVKKFKGPGIEFEIKRLEELEKELK